MQKFDDFILLIFLGKEDLGGIPTPSHHARMYFEAREDPFCCTFIGSQIEIQ